MSNRPRVQVFFIVTVVFILLSCPLVIAVSPEEIETHRITPESAQTLADAAYLEFMLSGSPGLVSGSWGESVLARDPTIIYDTNGEPLFYHFTILDDTVPLGGIKIGASRVLPSSVMAIELTPPYWNPEETAKRAEDSLLSINPLCSIVSSDTVCYSYPKIGQKITCIRAGSEVQEEYIFDGATSTQVPDGISWSYYGTIEEETVPGNHAFWEEEETIHRLVLEKARVYGYSGTTSLSNEKMKVLREAILPEYRAGSGEVVVRGASGAVTAAPGKKVLPLTLHPQEQNDWCGVAAIQMISEFFGTSYNQEDIARWTNTRNGMYVEDQTLFFRNYLGKGESYSDYDPSFQKEVYEIENNRPFGSNVDSHTLIGGHARVGAGYNDEWGRNEIYIYDPWPMDRGSVYWEAFSSVNHICDVYIRGADTPRVQPPVARFSYSFTGTTVSFTDLSTGTPDAWYWTFGDGTTATIQNPSHTYAQSGSYWVTLTVSNNGGSARNILAVYIPPENSRPTPTPTSAPAGFLKPTISSKIYPTASPTPVSTVSVTILPTGYPKIYPTASPTPVSTVPVTILPTGYPKIYPTASPTPVSTVPVTILPTGYPKIYPTASPTPVSTVPVTILPTGYPKIYPTASPTPAVPSTPGTFSNVISFLPVANFQYIIKGTWVTFIDTSQATPTGWSWSFGDGTGSDARNPTHTYREPGSYTVTLTVKNSAGSTEVSKILTVGPPKAE
jgi:PKD repeat protein